MKYYQDLAPLEVFTSEDAAKVIGNAVNAYKNLNLMVKEGSIRRIKRNLYTCINLITGEDAADRFMIASALTEDSYAAFHTAFELYGFYNQMFYDVQVSSTKRFAPFEDEGYSYRWFASSTLEQVDIVRGVRVTTLERTVVDSINMLGKVMDVEELVKCLELIHILSEEKIKQMLFIYDKDILYRKVGYVLSAFKEQLHISDSFFEFCREHSNIMNRGSLLGNVVGELEYVPEWGLYAYKDLFKLTDKGGREDV